jgi:DNA-binding LacI/PurR family transcriptional regulator
MSVAIDSGMAAAYVLDDAVQALCDAVGADNADIVRAELIRALAAGRTRIVIVGAPGDFTAMDEAVKHILSVMDGASKPEPSSREDTPTPEETVNHAEMTAERGTGPNARVVININFNKPMLEPGTFNFFGRAQP